MLTERSASEQVALLQTRAIERAAIATFGVGFGLTVLAIHALRIIPGTSNGDLVIPGLFLILVIALGTWGRRQLQRVAAFSSLSTRNPLSSRHRTLTRALWIAVLVGNPLAIFQGRVAGAALLAFGLYAIWDGISGWLED